MNHVPGAPRQSKRLLLGLGVLVLVLAAFFVGRSTSSGPSPRAPQPDAAQVPDPGPTAEVNGVPVGYARTEDGAVAAATEFARIMTAASGDRSQYISSLETLAAPQWQTTAAELAANGYEFFKNRYGDEGLATFSPLRYRVEEFSDEEARVNLWGVLTVSTAKATLEESWMTGTLDLVWINSDWRVVDQSSQPGPTPRLFQSRNGLSADDLAGFEDYDRAPAP